MKSLSYIPASDGSGDASLMTITQVRTAPATTITVNTVAGAPTNFFATMGTPHTFNDPVTGEAITTISEATAVNFAGRIDSGKVEIVAIAPGETDLGSKVGDIIIIRPTTQWADNIHDILSESLNDNGTLKNKSVTLANMNGGSTPGVLTTDASGVVTANPPRVFYMGDKNNDATAAGNTLLTWKTKPFDTASGGNAGAGTYTIPVGGYWRFNGRVSAGSNLRIYSYIANGTGTELLRGMDFTNTAAGMSTTVSGILKLNAGDVVTLRVYTSGASTFEVGVEKCFFQGELIQPA